MNNRYYVAVPISPANLAGTKAREDIEALEQRRGMQRIQFCGENTAKRNLIKRVQLIWQGIGNWIRLYRTAVSNSLVCIQYPLYPMKSARFARRIMRYMQRRKLVRFVALVHDLNSARSAFGKAARYSDRYFLRQFDYVICHNNRMRDYLADKGFHPARLIPLGVFDYLTSEDMAIPSVPELCSVNIAGNLSREKSAYLYDLIASGLQVRLFLYGAGFEPSGENPLATYEGNFPAETLPSRLRGAFGLVWDGESISTCSGDYGAYLALNNPHKLSLSLCAGIPVILWNGAALADYVEKNRLGFCIGSLTELEDRLSAIDQETYNIMRENAAREGARIRAGFYFDRAIGRVEDECSIK